MEREGLLPLEGNAATVPGPHGPELCWDFPLEGELARRITDSLLNGYGAVLDGDVGAGRRGVARQALEALSGRIHRVHFATLAQVPWQETGNRQDHARALHESLSRESGGLPIVVFVGNNHMVTEPWAAVLGALVIFGGVSVLALSHDKHSVIEAAMAQAAHLERIRILPLTYDETGEWLRTVLGGPVSRTATFQLWTASAGQRHFLQAVAADWMDAGYLRRSEGLWVVSGALGPVGGHTSSLWNRILDALLPGERTLVEVVALSGSIALSTLLSLVSEDELDAVHELGILDIDSSHLPTLRLRGEIANRVVATGIAPGRAARLLTLARQCTGFPKGIQLDRLFDWERMSGVAASSTLILEEADRSIREGAGQRALELLAGASDLAGTVRYRAMKLRALISCGHLSMAKQEISGLALVDWLRYGDVETASWPGLDSSADTAAELVLALGIVEYLAYSGESPAVDPRRMATRIKENVHFLYVNSLLDEHSYKNACADVESMLARLAMYFGKAHWVESPSYDHPDLRGAMLKQWQASLDSAAVWSGGVDGGLSRRSEMTILSHLSDEPGVVKRDARLQFFGLKIVAGEWAEAWNVLDGSWMAGKSFSNLNHESGLYAGLLDALTGRHEEAVATLDPEALQLRAYDPYRISRVVLAAMASSHAAMGNPEASRIALLSLDAVGKARSYTADRMEKLFRALALHDLDRRGEASAALHEMMEQEQENGNNAWALLEAAVAVSLGHHESVETLGELSRGVEGRFAEACGQFVEALREHRTDGMLSAAGSLALLGHQRLSLTIQDLAASGEPVIGKHRVDAGRRPGLLTELDFKAALDDGGDPPVQRVLESPEVRERWLQWSKERLGLTRRQAEIALLAGLGRSNRQIADELDMSIRTAESHLYQIFGKLGVRKRSDLRQLMQEQTGSPEGLK